jgi:diaminopimelate decarboxylase
MTDLGDVVTFAGMTEVEQGDLLAVMTAGAYGAAQSGT